MGTRPYGPARFYIKSWKLAPHLLGPAGTCAALRWAALEALNFKASGDVNSGFARRVYQIEHQTRIGDRTTHPHMYNLVFWARPPMVRKSTKFDNVKSGREHLNVCSSVQMSGRADTWTVVQVFNITKNIFLFTLLH